MLNYYANLGKKAKYLTQNWWHFFHFRFSQNISLFFLNLAWIFIVCQSFWAWLVSEIILLNVLHYLHYALMRMGIICISSILYLIPYLQIYLLCYFRSIKIRLSTTINFSTHCATTRFKCNEFLYLLANRIKFIGQVRTKQIGQNQFINIKFEKFSEPP